MCPLPQVYATVVVLVCCAFRFVDLFYLRWFLVGVRLHFFFFTLHERGKFSAHFTDSMIEIIRCSFGAKVLTQKMSADLGYLLMFFDGEYYLKRSDIREVLLQLLKLVINRFTDAVSDVHMVASDIYLHRRYTSQSYQRTI